MTDLYTTIIAGIFLAFIILVLMKPFWQWYYDITEIKKNQKEQIEILKEISEKLKPSDKEETNPQS
jgi:H+/gluconate symporter-like permease